MPNYYLPNLICKLQSKAVILIAALVLLISPLANAEITALFQNNGKIAGSVVDEKGETIPGVTVVLAGTSIGAQTGIDGSFSFSVKPGTYTVEVKLISYQTKQITGVVVKSGDLTSLNISLKPQTTTLNEVVITSSFAKASVEGLYAKQKNAATISNGISAEQIQKTPDANVGQSLKRISGLTTFDNKYVVVRGISERYNVATVDGTPMPSTDYSSRNFNFDLIPTEMIEGITVLKTVTPDLPVGFAGGLVQINTRDIPTKNFVSFTVGTGGNDQSTGKTFLSTARGKYDYFGFDDGNRKMINGPLKATQGESSNINNSPFTASDYEQSKRFTNNWKLYEYKAMPNQNYSLSLGQTYNLKNNSSSRLGFILALNYRNTQTITEIQNKRGAFAMPPDLEARFNGKPSGEGNIYNFNTTFGGILNVGYRSQKNQISSRNAYTRTFSNPTTIMYGYDTDDGLVGPEYAYSLARIVTEPDFLTLTQNKIQGEHQLPFKLKWIWDVSRTAISRERKDMLRRQLSNENQEYGEYFHDGVNGDAISVYPLSRQGMKLNEVDYNWSTAFSRPIFKDNFAGTFKIGYVGFKKKQNTSFSNVYIRPSTGNGGFELGRKFNIENEHIDENFAPNRFVYEVPAFGLNEFTGLSNFHAGYAMIDQKLWSKLRVIGGLRVEHFNLNLLGDRITTAEGLFSNPNTILIPDDRDVDKPWQILPAFNVTYSVNDRLNLRAAYSQSMVRPEFNERSLSSVYSAPLQGNVTGGIVISTKTTSYDVRAEFYPGSGEIISIGGFYKFLDRPLELTKQNAQDLYIYSNSISAKSYGIEAELRRKLGFINETLPILDKFTFYSNFTLLWSKVVARLPPFATAVNDDPANPVFKLGYEIDPQNRPLYGQTPFLLNTGLEYNGDLFGLNIVHNHTGRKFYILTNNPGLNEWEAPYSQVDVQLNANLFQKKGKIRLNFGNIFNNENFFYNGQASYENAPDGTRRLKPGYTDGFEKDDLVSFRRTFGRTFIVTFNYTF